LQRFRSVLGEPIGLSRVAHPSRPRRKRPRAAGRRPGPYPARRRRVRLACGRRGPVIHRRRSRGNAAFRVGARKDGQRRSGQGLLMHALVEAVGEPRRQVDLVSGYFVPTRAGVESLGGFADRGVSVSVFTNSFAASDVWLVHAGYAPYRQDLLRRGVRLFEMRGPPPGARPQRRRIATAGSGSGLGSDGGPVLRSSATTLHAKTFAIDRERVFIGSFNFDPRS